MLLAIIELLPTTTGAGAGAGGAAGAGATGATGYAVVSNVSVAQPPPPAKLPK